MVETQLCKLREIMKKKKYLDNVSFSFLVHEREASLDSTPIVPVVGTKVLRERLLKALPWPFLNNHIKCIKTSSLLVLYIFLKTCIRPHLVIKRQFRFGSVHKRLSASNAKYYRYISLKWPEIVKYITHLDCCRLSFCFSNAPTKTPGQSSGSTGDEERVCRMLSRKQKTVCLGFAGASRADC